MKWAKCMWVMAFGVLFAAPSFAIDVLSTTKTLFIENEGQYPKAVLFRGYPAGITLYRDGMRIRGIRIEFEGMSKGVRIRGREISRARFNYFIGRDSKKWKRNIPSYESVIYEGIYEGIDLVLTGMGGRRLEFQWIVHPDADPGRIRMRVRCDRCSIHNNGNELWIEREGERVITMGNLRAYQGFEEVEVSYQVNGNVIGFRTGEYDRRYTLIIDPLLASTYFGGSDEDKGYGIALDNSGNVYIAGVTYSGDFPITSGAFDTDYGGEGDVFISILDPYLGDLISSTFLGGSQEDGTWGVDIKIYGNSVYVVGSTISSDFPVTSGAYDGTPNGNYDVFITKFNPGLDSLIASTLFGGSDYDISDAITIDPSGNVYIAGWTWSEDLPTTSGAFDGTHNGGSYDGFVSKFDGNLSNLLASTYLGGSDADVIMSIAGSDDGNIYVVGYTGSTDFPVTSGAYDGSLNGSYDVFISRLNEDLSTLTSSTFIGGSSLDYGFGISFGLGGEVYITGITRSADFPATSDAFDPSYSGQDFDIFVSRFDGVLGTLLSSTFLGGSGRDWGNDLLVGSDGNVYVYGWTSSEDFPTTPDAYDTTFNDSTDIVVSILDANLHQLIMSTYLGGSNYDYIFGMALNDSGNIFITGKTLSNDFPTVSGAYDETYNGYSDAFVSVLGSRYPIPVREAHTGNYVLVRGRKIIIHVESPSYLGMDVVDPSGRLVRRMTAGFVNAGYYEFSLSNIPSGSYILRIRVGEAGKFVKFVSIE